MKESVMLNEKDQSVCSKQNVKLALPEVAHEEFEETIKFCVSQGCLRTYKSKNKTFLVLLKEKIEEVDAHKKEKKIGYKIFNIIKKSGFENENEESVCAEKSLKRELSLKEDDYTLAVKFCVEQGCLRTYQSKDRTFLVLIKEEFEENGNQNSSNDKLLSKIIELMKETLEETEEGLLFIADKECQERLKINSAKLKSVVKLGIKEKKLKREIKNQT